MVLSQNPIIFFGGGDPHVTARVQGGVGEKKIGARFDALGIRTPQFLVPVQLKL